MTFDANVGPQIFQDGALATSQAGLPAIAFRSVNLRVGCRSDDGNYYDGSIDEMRMYGRVLSAVEISMLATP